MLADRAIDGVEEIYYRGELVGTRRRYDARLLLAHIARLDRLVDEDAAGPDAARFDELLARIAGAESPAVHHDEDRLLPGDRAALADIAAEEAEDKVNQAWAEAAGGKPPKLAQAEYEAYLAERDAAAGRARAEAAAQWDEWIVRACGTVDALAGWPDTPPLPGLPGSPVPAAPPAAGTSETSVGLSFPGHHEPCQPPPSPACGSPGRQRASCLRLSPGVRGRSEEIEFFRHDPAIDVVGKDSPNSTARGSSPAWRSGAD